MDSKSVIIGASVTLLLVVLLGGAYALGKSGSSSNGDDAKAIAQATATLPPTLLATATPLLPTATPEPTQPPPEPSATKPATSVQQTASQPTPTPAAAASCVTTVTLTLRFPEAYYYVSGSTLEELSASLVASSITQFGDFETFFVVGLTEYPPTVDDGYCTKAGQCYLGTMTIEINGRVTLPRHTKPSSIQPDIKPLWDGFVSRVTIHEYRHVTIIKEELAIMRDKLVALDPQPTCDEMEHEVDKVWFWGWRAMEDRQQAFHEADAYGAGGLVAR